MQSIQKDQQKAKRRRTTIQAKATTGDAKKEDNSDDVTLFDGKKNYCFIERSKTDELGKLVLQHYHWKNVVNSLLSGGCQPVTSVDCAY